MVVCDFMYVCVYVSLCVCVCMWCFCVSEGICLGMLWFVHVALCDCDGMSVCM